MVKLVPLALLVLLVKGVLMESLVSRAVKVKVGQLDKMEEQVQLVQLVLWEPLVNPVFREETVKKEKVVLLG